jgi:hypothetical protein
MQPELLLCILLTGHLYRIISERTLVEERRLHLQRRWYRDLGFDRDMLHHSTFSKERPAISQIEVARKVA